MILIISVMISLSSNNWISMWIGLELNMMSFTPLILNKINKSASEAAMIYFLTQSVSSMLLLMMILIYMCKYLTSMKLCLLIINMSILIKLGAAPFHMWMPKIMTSMNWLKCFTLMTLQKLAPLFMISNLNNSIIINLSILLSIVIGSLGGINQTSLRKMLGYSSINHIGWMLAINKSMNLWIIYLMIYSMMMMVMCYTFNSYKMNYMNQMSMLNMTNMEKFSMFMMMLSMGGLPPFLGFLPKWITIQNMINESEFIMITVMIMFSLITLMFYLRVMTNMFLSYNSSIKWMINNQNKLTPMMIIMINSMLPLIMIMDIVG
uniref:NADH-ubiquinone oxidoreductase chain 2 n=1 Tax=Menida violacea TaxID=763257 RepID=A0A5C1D5U9_9HEMI|nr:NADH dehydrogenase subunit 2 [Menida metallica]QEL51205.1 NADH dehydrogenase subunit 2 [Menida violacea]WDD39678.1 NADH dehydrogenase subunit 2 [Menida metallica]